MKKLLGLLVLATLVVTVAHFTFKRNDPAQGEPRHIDVGMRMTVKEFIARNRLGMGPREPQGYVIDVDKLNDVMPMFFNDNWMTLRVLDGDQSFDLPAGRTLQVTQRAGRVIGMSFRPFDQPKPLNEMRAYVTDLLASLEKKGWRKTSSSKIPSSKDDFGSGGKALFGAMQSASGAELMMTLVDYGLAPKRESFILLPDPTHRPAESSSTYLLMIDVNYYPEDVYRDFIYPRRIFENGDQNHELPMRRWIEDPDWTPEKAGMVPTTAEERAKIDPSNWKMAPK